VTGAKPTDTFHGSLEATSSNSVNSPLRRPIVLSLSGRASQRDREATSSTALEFTYKADTPKLISDVAIAKRCRTADGADIPGVFLAIEAIALA
jgi:hypothetical protein